ncbi:MAG TPA: hypothetical protein VNI78_07930 [Vicinamibacterales bacterium]|nr:hypothetical protein [Vicinamibacterales bacterium]
MRQLGDRRGSVRLEVVGTLWAGFEIGEAVEVLNVSDGGALVAAHTPPPLDSVQSIQLTIEGRDIRKMARVRHLRRREDAAEPQYLVGLEFVGEPEFRFDHS